MTDLIRRARREEGFTLIELLVVVVIIGILIAIAIPLYLNYENGAKNKSAASDLRGAITAIEQCFGNNGTYPGSFTATGTATPCPGQTVVTSSGVTLNYAVSTTTPIAYSIVSKQSGSSTWYCYTSALGGPVKTEATTSPAFDAAYHASC